MNSTVHDDLLFSMLKDCKTLPVFLDHIFGFLNRRTDFYHIKTDETSPVGFPPNLAETLVKQSFYHWKSQTNVTPEEPVKQVGNINRSVVENVDFSPSEFYNGQVMDKYCWSQTLNEIDVFVKIPPETNTKDLTVRILPDKLLVKQKDEVLIEGELCDKCKNNEAIWSVEKGRLELHLDKTKEMWWNCLIKTEPKLDINTLDCSRPYEELSEEAQAKIEELQWNQERKRQNLPTSDELKMQGILKEAWNAEGSPFSGPYNPDSVQLQ